MAVEFNEPTYGTSSASLPKRGGLAALVIKLGLAKDDKQAQSVLIVVLVIVVALTIGTFVLGGSGSSPVPPEASIPPDDLIVE